jgi:hypothetical protein
MSFRRRTEAVANEHSDVLDCAQYRRLAGRIRAEERDHLGHALPRSCTGLGITFRAVDDGSTDGQIDDLPVADRHEIFQCEGVYHGALLSLSTGNNKKLSFMLRYAV